MTDRSALAQAQQDAYDDLWDKVQYLVDWIHDMAWLDEGSFTFPDGETWAAGDTREDWS